MKYPIVISYHSITNHITANHIIIHIYIPIISQQIISLYISIYTLPKKKEFVLKFQENKNIYNKDILHIKNYHYN